MNILYHITNQLLTYLITYLQVYLPTNQLTICPHTYPQQTYLTPFIPTNNQRPTYLSLYNISVSSYSCDLEGGVYHFQPNLRSGSDVNWQQPS